MLTYKEFINENGNDLVLKITKVISNSWGSGNKKKNLSKKEIIELLNDPNEITDDESFETLNGKHFYLGGELEGLTVEFENKQYKIRFDN